MGVKFAMLPRKMLLLSCFYLCFVPFFVEANRARDKMYDTIQGAAACFRRLNGTHQFGCASKRSGNVGVLHVVNNADDLQWLLDKAPVPPYTAVISHNMLTRSVMTAFKNSDQVNGVVLLKLPEGPGNLISYTHEDRCPNRYSGLSSLESQTCTDVDSWNPEGTALLQEDWGFPVFYVTNYTSVKKIQKCYETHNSDHINQEALSLCAIEMRAFMFAAKDSETCIRRSNMITNLNPMRYCDPLGDVNIWSTLFPRKKTEPEKNNSVILVTARMDATSFFDGEVPGAGGSVVGIVALLATAQMLASLKDEMEPLSKGRNIMFALLNGEAYDYIGSSRLVYSMKHGKFPAPSTQLPPLNISNIHFMVELNQVTNLNESNGLTSLFMHPTPYDTPYEDLRKFTRIMRSQVMQSKINFNPTVTKKMPPSSLQSFLKEKPNFPGMVITDFENHFTNKFYHSVLDNAKLLNYTYLNGSEAKRYTIQDHLARMTTTLAKSLYQMITDQPYKGTVRVDDNLIDELLFCYLKTMNCRMFRSVRQDKAERVPNYPPSMYVGVYIRSLPNYISTRTGNVLALLTGTKLNLTKEQCKNNQSDLTQQYIWMLGTPSGNNSVCILTTMNYSMALSPAFDNKTEYNWSSGEYSTWTESVWNEFSVRIFLKPSAAHEAFVLSLGCMVFVVSFAIIWAITSRTSILFNTNTLNGGC